MHVSFTTNTSKKFKLLHFCFYYAFLKTFIQFLGSDIGKVSDATRKEERRSRDSATSEDGTRKEERRSRDSATSEDDHLCTQVNHMLKSLQAVIINDTLSQKISENWTKI